MQTVITAKQAQEITGGRKPLVPVVYEEAVKALGECLSLDDAKYWDNKADALAAWAKIYHDDKVGRQARALKLEAYRRMGTLAGELRGFGRRVLATVGRKGRAFVNIKTARGLLMEKGLSSKQARAAIVLAKMERETFAPMVEGPRPPAPQSVATRADKNPCASAIRAAARAVRGIPAKTMTTCIPRRDVEDLQDWCDAFLQAAGK